MTGCSLLSNLLNNSEESSQNNNSSGNQTSSNSESSEESSETGDPTDLNPTSSEAQEVTISSLLSSNGKSSNNTKLYRITGIAQWPKNTNYGNFDLVDSTGYVYVYGCSKNKTSITKNGSTYSFSNDQTFSSIGIKPGDQVTMEGLYVWYSVSSSYGYAEFQGYVTSVVHKNESTIIAGTYSTTETYSGSYYNSISDSDSGTSLLAKLHELMFSTHTSWTSYSSLDSYFYSSDKTGSKVKCFYSGEATTSFNKEHIWPQSLSNNLYGTDHAGSDLQHIRPTISTYNSKRGNSMFGPIFGDKTSIGKISYSGGGNDYYTGNVFEPADSIKGDVARIIMYVYMHYSSEISGITTTTYCGQLKINWVMGTSPTDSWKLLRKWNAEDPVSQDEITRNDYAYSIQHNRNPFIDHPSYADRIWA